MKGKNRLILNNATMLQIVSDWFKGQWAGKEDTEVTGFRVAEESKALGPDDPQDFEVELDSAPKVEET